MKGCKPGLKLDWDRSSEASDGTPPDFAPDYRRCWAVAACESAWTTELDQKILGLAVCSAWLKCTLSEYVHINLRVSEVSTSYLTSISLTYRQT
jgi:hypothetical protein